MHCAAWLHSNVPAAPAASQTEPGPHTRAALKPAPHPLPAAACVGLPLWAAANWFRSAVPDAWAWALGLHLLSWFVQIAVSGWEQRRMRGCE